MLNKQFTWSRNEGGAAGGTLVLVLVPIAFLLGSMAVDFAHMDSVRCELQNATDAAALAGAQDLALDPANVVPRAEQIASENFADGRAVSDATPGTSVFVDVVPATPVAVGQVRVTAQMSVNHLFAPMFGRRSDTLTAVSVATGGGTLSGIAGGTGFPLVVSWNAAPEGNGTSDPDHQNNGNGNGKDKGTDGGDAGIDGGGEIGIDGGGETTTSSSTSYSQPPLSQSHLGDTIELNFNSQDYKNVAWSSLGPDPASGSVMNDYIDVALGLKSASDAGVSSPPPVSTGDVVRENNGNVAATTLTSGDRYAALMDGRILILPVVDSLPPMNQTATVIGFIAFKPTLVSTDHTSPGQVLTIRGTLIKAIVPGTAAPNDPTDDMAELTPVPTRLVATSSYAGL